MFKKFTHCLGHAMLIIIFLYTRVVSKVSFPVFFFMAFLEPNVKLQGDIIFEFLETLKIMWQSLYKNVQNAVLKMELLLHVVVPCEVCSVIHFPSAQNKSAVEIQQESVFGIQ